MEIQHQKELRKQATLGLAGMVASAVLGTTLTYCAVTSNCERKINELRRNAVFERAELYLEESLNRALRGEQYDRNEIARQYKIPLTERGEIDYEALHNVIFPLEEQD